MTAKEPLQRFVDFVNSSKIDEVNTLVFYGYEIEELKKFLKEHKRLQEFKETFDNYELSKRQDFIAFENWLECERELAVIKCDVKRFMELYEQAREKWGNGIDDKEAIEYTKLHLKLLEVGMEE